MGTGCAGTAISRIHGLGRVRFRPSVSVEYASSDPLGSKSAGPMNVFVLIAVWITMAALVVSPPVEGTTERDGFTPRVARPRNTTRDPSDCTVGDVACQNWDVTCVGEPSGPSRDQMSDSFVDGLRIWLKYIFPAVGATTSNCTLGVCVQRSNSLST